MFVLLYAPLRKGGSVIKSQLLARIAAAHPHLYGHKVEKVLDAILDEIANALANGSRVELRGFCVFYVKTRKARRSRNPSTGAQVLVKEKKALGFKIGKEMRDRLNKQSYLSDQ